MWIDQGAWLLSHCQVVSFASGLNESDLCDCGHKLVGKRDGAGEEACCHLAIHVQLFVHGGDEEHQHPHNNQPKGVVQYCEELIHPQNGYGCNCPEGRHAIAGCSFGFLHMTVALQYGLYSKDILIACNQSFQLQNKIAPLPLGRYSRKRRWANLGTCTDFPFQKGLLQLLESTMLQSSKEGGLLGKNQVEVSKSQCVKLHCQP